MNKEEINIEEINRKKGILVVFLSLVCITIAQSAMIFVQIFIEKLTGSQGIGNIFSAAAYIAATYGLLWLIVKYILKGQMQDYRIGKISLKWRWIIAGILLPLLVSGLFILLPGTFYNNEIAHSQYFAIVTEQIFVYGLSAGVVEEMIFRGVLMGALEKSFSRKCAVILPSVIFALGHISGALSNPKAVVMILISGVLVGVMFSLIACESGSVWNGALVHAIWNASVIGGVLCISTIQNKETIFAYVLDQKYDFLTAGFETIEPSWIAIAGYAMVCIFAVWSMKKQDSKEQINSETK